MVLLLVNIQQNFEPRPLIHALAVESRGNGKAFGALIRELGQKTMVYRGEAFRCSCNERVIYDSCNGRIILLGDICLEFPRLQFPRNSQTTQKPTDLNFWNPQNSLRFARHELTEMIACLAQCYIVTYYTSPRRRRPIAANYTHHMERRTPVRRASND